MSQANPAVLSAAGRATAAALHGYPPEVIARRRQELVLARASHLLESSGITPLDEDLVSELIAVARGAH